jgi:hypothetical protein
MRAAFAQVGHVSRDRNDLSYDRPLTVAPERRLGLRQPI